MPDPLACDTRNCASAQEYYFLDNTSYYSGDCSGLPGFVPSSPDAFFSTAGYPTDFVVAGSDETAGRTCTWTSNPAFGDGHLICAD